MKIGVDQTQVARLVSISIIPSDLSLSTVQSFQSYIFLWWEKNRRDLPWRNTRDPYRILVSELMLQQTQVSRVLPKYVEFLTLFPDVFSLANASIADVLKAWKGMGYNRRALYLKKLAENISAEYSGIFPKDEKRLLSLPGLGTYTARAVLVFAFEQDVAMIDTNIRQIIVHHFFGDVPQKESRIQDVADQLVPKGRSWDWHQALMDYGAIEMKKISLEKRKADNALLRDTGEKKYKVKAVPFEQTNRFSRGKIVDLLREGEHDEAEILSYMKTRFQKSADHIQAILEGLIRDGLIERGKDGIISLPK